MMVDSPLSSIENTVAELHPPPLLEMENTTANSVENAETSAEKVN
jgi:hypothetical protein